MISNAIGKMSNLEHDVPSTSYKTEHKVGSLSLSLHQRRRSHSSSFSVGTSPYASSQRQRTHTAGGSSSPGTEVQRSTLQNQRRSPSTSASSARFVTSTSDFHLPQRFQSPTITHASVFASSTLVSPKAHGSSSVDDSAAASYSSLPLLRRKAAAAAFAHASRKGLRRGSMLGKEVAKPALQDSDSDCEDDMEIESNDKSRSPSSPLETKEGIDEDMQIDSAEVTIAEVDLESKTSRSPSPGVRNTTATRRAVQRRTNLLPKDRGVLRVAASLRDETRPAEGEIASEAKLQRRLGPDSDSYIPTTPKLMARRSQSPFGHASGSTLDRSNDVEDFCFADPAHFDMSDDSEYDGDDDMVTTRNGHSVPLDADTASEYFDQGIAIPGAEVEAAQREKLWNSFRNTGHPRLSPGVDRSNYRGRGASVAPSGPTAPSAPLSSSLGSALDHTMETEQYTAVGSSPSLWGKSVKRKNVDDRYEPYSASSVYKRRAVSPVALVSVGNRGQSNAPSTTLSPRQAGLSQVSPLFMQAPYAYSGNNHLPTPTPLSIPSPTISLARMHGSASRSFAVSMSSNRVGMSTSTNPSPSSTRPSTHTNTTSLNPFGAAAAPSPSLLSSSASKTVTTPGATGGNGGGGGSGPGYGSGALGLSLGGGSKRYKEEQQEIEEEEGMLGDVSAIKLGEM